MRIKMTPGNYNAELVEKVNKIMNQPNRDEMIDELAEIHGKDALMDAVYYACEARDEWLADQEAYFQQQLADEEFPHFMERFLAS